MQRAECKMQNEGTSVAAHTGAPRDEVGLGNRQEAIGNRGREDVTVGAHSVRPQPAEASTSCHSERSEESVSPVLSLPLSGKVPPQGADEVDCRQAAAIVEALKTTDHTSFVSGLAGEACCHLPLEGKAYEGETTGGGIERTTMSLIARAQAGDKAATEQLLEENIGLIRAVARRYWGRGVEAEDLFQLGSMGFLKAVAGFDLAFGTRFSTYAVPKIAGEIRRFLRDDGAVKVSRTLKERAVAIHQARDRLSKALGREPVLSELAEALDLTVEEIAEAESAADPVASIQQPAGDDGLTLEAVLTDSPMEEQLVERLALRQALERLPKREARVLALRYFHAMTQDRAARIVGVSQVQISRIEKKALAHLRELLE